MMFYIAAAIFIICLITLFFISRKNSNEKDREIEILRKSLEISRVKNSVLEEEKKDLEIKLRHNQKLKTIGTLTRGIAHDFNNLLSPIIGYSDIALSKLTPSDTTYIYVNEISRAASKAREQVEQMQLFNTAIDGDNSKEVDLAAIIRETVTIIKPMIPSSIEIDLQIEDSPLYVSIPSSQLHQMLMGLCTNAWQAMNENGGLLTIYAGQNDNHMICLEVKDTGTGIDKDVEKHIFEPFFTTREKETNSGLGLSIVKGIIDSSKGRITFSSTPGKGSVFSIYLPAKRPTKINATGKKPIQSISGDILVVDDDDHITNMICDMLTDFGFHVEQYNNSRDALQAFKKQPRKYNLVITDLTMPKMTGRVLKREIEKIRKSIPILIMTGFGSDFEQKTMLKKPFRQKELISAIENILG